MMASLSEAEREEIWQEIEQELEQLETGGEFEGPCEMVVGSGIK